MTPLDNVGFDTTGYTLREETSSGNPRFWQTPEGDGLGMYYFAMPPDLPVNAASVEALAAMYRQQLAPVEGGKLVEVAVVSAGGSSAVRTIISVPQKPSGRIYVGSLTVPFQDFSFVVKCQCAESSPTGLKEAILFDRSRAANEPITIYDNGTFTIPGWNSDDAKYDVEFSRHPVARVRRVLEHVRDSLTIADELRKMPGFPLPQGYQ